MKKKMNGALWIAQGLLALVFLFAGGMKLVLPVAAMATPLPLPGAFLRFIGTVEVLGAVGLVLPGLLRIRPTLTALAAAGLVIVMTGATVVTIAGGETGAAIVPAIIGALAASIAYGRWRVVPFPAQSRHADARVARSSACASR